MKILLIPLTISLIFINPVYAQEDAVSQSTSEQRKIQNAFCSSIYQVVYETLINKKSLDKAASAATDIFLKQGLADPKNSAEMAYVRTTFRGIAASFVNDKNAVDQFIVDHTSKPDHRSSFINDCNQSVSGIEKD